MAARILLNVALCLGIFFALLTSGGSGAQAASPSFQTSSRAYFHETGQYLDGTFLAYWQEHGGLPIFGFPLTPAFRENGYLTQYFERARFELHPENAGTPFEVLLGQLGLERLQSEDREVPAPDSVPPGSDEALFPETGYKVADPFLQYWLDYGGLAQFGYPISPRLTDESGLSVQYFERARFEHHPEYAGTPSEVLLTLLGVEKAATLDPLLRAKWPANLPVPNGVGIPGQSHGPVPVPMLSSIGVRSALDGELVVLGGDNRPYARYSIVRGEDVPVTAAGMWGEHSLVLLQNGAPVAAYWGAFSGIEPDWGIRAYDPVWDSLYGQVERFLAADAVDYLAPDEVTPVHGYRSPDSISIWLRDHVHQSKGFKYFEPDMTSALDYFASTQRADGSYDDYLYNTLFTPVFRDQIEIEADREYLFVEGVWTAWQATGDDRWLEANLMTMERGMAHLWGDLKRWSPEHGLIKRAFTIDTWDFEQGSDMGTVRRSIDSNTKWSIMHGDNTGAAHAARTLAAIERYLGREDEARIWDGRAASLADNINRLAWNGNFYTHQVHLTPVDPTGVDESTQLSLSNAYALNRGTLSQEQATALINTYQERRAANEGNSFAEWYSINPAFPLGFGPQGEYVNGGIMPLVGGELARGAFSHGFEAYGVDILRRYHSMIERDGGTYLWYYPDGTPGFSTAHTLDTDGWGSSAMLSAFTEGLAGVVDHGKLYRSVELSPRWAVECNQRDKGCYNRDYTVALRYPASGTYFSYRLRFSPDSGISITWGGRQTEQVYLHLLLPNGMAPQSLSMNGVEQPFTTSTVEGSLYLDALLPGSGSLEIR